MSRHFIAGAVSLAAAILVPLAAAGPITVPNASFESPSSGFVNINVDSWEKSPKPDDYVEGGGFLWSQLIGLFKNTGATSPDHIDNCDGDQALWLFAIPEVAMYQDYDTLDWDDAIPTHAFDATYETGKSYQLTIGVIGTGGGMQQGASMEIGLYYRDFDNNHVAVARTSITNTPSTFTNNTHFINFAVSVPVVKADDAWAGKHIGVQMLSTVTTNLQGGYWDLDNVRLRSVEEPALLNPVLTNGQFQFTLRSEPGTTVEILSTTNLVLPMADWTRVGVITNTTGIMAFTESVSGAERFYRTQRIPQ